MEVSGCSGEDGDDVRKMKGWPEMYLKVSETMSWPAGCNSKTKGDGQ